MEKQRYKDQCDECKKFDYCKGVNGRVLCPTCAQKEENKDNGQENNGDTSEGSSKTNG